jgi:hypothetical protein
VSGEVIELDRHRPRGPFMGPRDDPDDLALIVADVRILRAIEEAVERGEEPSGRKAWTGLRFLVDRLREARAAAECAEEQLREYALLLDRVTRAWVSGDEQRMGGCAGAALALHQRWERRRLLPW